MSESGYGVCVTGATTLLGKEVLGSLGETKINLRMLHPVDALNVETVQVVFRGKSMSVGLLSPQVLEEVDLVLVTVQPDAAGVAMLDEAADAGCLVLDLVGYRGQDGHTPMIIGRNPAALEGLREVGAALCPSAVALALSAVGGALRPLGLQQIRGSAMISASVAGEAGVRELSGQVAALFNSQTPPRVHFEHGLAFDLLPAWGEPMDKGWTAAELTVSAQVSRVLGLSPAAVVVDQLVVPLFVGMGISLQLYGQGLKVESVTRALQAVEGIDLHLQIDDTLMPRGLAGQASLAVGRLRADPAGAGVHLFVAADPIRLPAANAVQAVLGLIELDLI